MEKIGLVTITFNSADVINGFLDSADCSNSSELSSLREGLISSYEWSLEDI